MRKILIVEDDQLVASAYQKRFKEAGFEVEWAPDGLEGIKLVSSTKPDVVLLDLLMPRLDGIEVLKYIRNHPELNHLPVVVFSNSYMTNLVENAWRAGADQCLMKASTTPAQLFDVVNKAIQKAAARVAASAPPAAHQIAPLSRPGLVFPLAPPLPLAAPPPTVRPLSPPTPTFTGGTVVTPLGSRPAMSPPRSAPPAPTPTPPAPAAAAPASPGPASGKAGGPGSSERGTSIISAEVEPEFQSQIQQLFLSGAPGKIAAIREAAGAFIQDQGSSMQVPLMMDLFRKVHSLTGNAAVAGFATMAHYASTLEALLQELQQKPKFINDSTVRTVWVAVELLDLLCQQGAKLASSPASAPILVVDADSLSSQAVVMALEKAELQTVVAASATQAMTLLTTGNFGLVVVAVDLPGMSGFELCAQIQTLRRHERTPVMFVTALANFAAHANPEVLGENDIVASPFLLIELTLKAVTHVEWRRLQQQLTAVAP